MRPPTGDSAPPAIAPVPGRPHPRRKLLELRGLGVIPPAQRRPHPALQPLAQLALRIATREHLRMREHATVPARHHRQLRIHAPSLPTARVIRSTSVATCGRRASKRALWTKTASPDALPE